MEAGKYNSDFLRHNQLQNNIINTGQIMANLRVKLGSSAQVGRFVRRREFNDSR